MTLETFNDIEPGDIVTIHGRAIRRGHQARVLEKPSRRTAIVIFDDGEIQGFSYFAFDLLKKESGAIYADLHRRNVEETVRTSASEMYNEEITKIESRIRSESNPQSENVYVLSEYLNYLKELKANVLKWKKTS